MTKKSVRRLALHVLLMSGAGLACSAYASNGLYTDGQGLKATTMGGVSIALPQDAMAAATNPAGMAYVGNRFDADVQLFIGSNHARYGSEDNRLNGHMTVPIPEFGVNYVLSPKLSFGVSSIGAGNGWKYDQPLLPGAGLPPFKALFKQVGLAPTIAYKATDTLAVGVSLAAAYQTLKVRGGAVPTPDGPLVFPYHGTRGTWAYGVRLGLLWKPDDALSLGFSYISKMWAGKFSGYSHDLLAAADGRIDSPAIISGGVAYRLTSRWTVAADYRWIRWSQVKGLASPETFGWHDQRVFRFGMAYEINQRWTVRGGMNLTNGQVHSDQVLANELIPGILSKSFSAGVTHSIGRNNEATLGVVRDLSDHIIGTGPSNGSSMNVKYAYVVLGFGHKF